MEDRDANTTDYALNPDVEHFYTVRRVIDKHFDVEGFSVSGNAIRFAYSGMRGDFKEIAGEFRELGYHPYLKQNGERKICVLMRARKKKDRESRREAVIAWLLLLVTFATTTAAGYVYSDVMVQNDLMANPWYGAFSFSIAIMLILGSHEMGHKIASIKNGIEATPPYFIPFPTIIGTMGAVIRIKSPTPDKNAAVALGASGPIVGFLVTIPILVAGIAMSPAVSVSVFTEGGDGTVMYFGESILFKILEALFLNVPEGKEIYLHPLAFAGWVGLFVTSLNLIPMGQLDGGHIARALLGDRGHSILNRALIGFLFAAGAVGFYQLYYGPGQFGALGDALSYIAWPGWLVWAILGYFITRRGYPRTMNEFEPVTRLSLILGIACLVIFLLCFMPNPIGVADVGSI